MKTLLIGAFGPPYHPPSTCSSRSTARAASCIQFRNRLTPEQRQAARDSFRNRLVHPSPSEVEQGIGAFLPRRLIALYNDHKTIPHRTNRNPSAQRQNPKNQRNLKAGRWIEAFLPLDLESQKYVLDLAAQGWGKGFCFATDGEGNFYWILANDERRPDAPVFFAHTDPGGQRTSRVVARRIPLLAPHRPRAREQSGRGLPNVRSQYSNQLALFNPKVPLGPAVLFRRVKWGPKTIQGRKPCENG